MIQSGTVCYSRAHVRDAEREGKLASEMGVSVEREHIFKKARGKARFPVELEMQGSLAQQE